MQSLESVSPIMSHMNIKSTNIELIRAVYTNHQRSKLQNRANYREKDCQQKGSLHAIDWGDCTYCTLLFIIHQIKEKRKRETKKNK